MNFVEDVVKGFPESREALIAIDRHGDRRVYRFGEVSAIAEGACAAMAARGVKRGDVVMTLIGNRPEWVVTLLACFRLGAVALPCNIQLRRADLRHRVAVADPKLAVGEAAYLAELPDSVPCLEVSELSRLMSRAWPPEAIPPPADLHPDDPALIVFTSGTTGAPKGALHPQRYLSGQALQARHWLGGRPGDTMWCTAATGWSKSSRNAFVAPWLCGATALLHDGRFDPVARLDLLERERVSLLCQSPTEYRMMASRADLRRLPALRRLVSAGEALNAGVIEEFRGATGLRIADGYGQTETGSVTGVRPGDPVQAREGTMGMPLPGIDARVGEAAAAKAPGEPVTGELQLRRRSIPTFFTGYLDESPVTDEWWRTGDVVRLEPDGFLYHEGRDDDIISSSGYRIGPVEVESALVSHPLVAEAAAVAADDPDRGAVVRAIVVLRDGRGSPELVRELQDHCKSVTAPYKFPRIIDFTDELPKTASGKIKRAQLRSDRGPTETRPTRPAGVPNE